MNSICAKCKTTIQHREPIYYIEHRMYGMQVNSRKEDIKYYHAACVSITEK